MKLIILTALLALSVYAELDGTAVKTCVDDLTMPSNTCATTDTCYANDVEALYTNDAVTDEEYDTAKDCLETLQGEATAANGCTGDELTFYDDVKECFSDEKSEHEYDDDDGENSTILSAGLVLLLAVLAL